MERSSPSKLVCNARWVLLALVIGTVVCEANAAPVAPPPGDLPAKRPQVTPEDRPAGPGGPPENEPGLPPPPLPGEGETEGETEGEDPIAAMQRRAQEFEDHLLRADAAMDKQRYDDAVREYSAALRLQPGDATASLGRALARKARTPSERCPTQAISDLRSLETYDPRGAWLEQRYVLVQWMEACGSSFAAERLMLAKQLAAEPPGAPGRPDDIRVVVARLQLAGAHAQDTGDNLRRAALQELEWYRQECARTKATPTAEGLRLQADLYRDVDAIERAVVTYEELLAAYPDAPESQGVTNLVRDLALERKLRELDATQGFRPKPEAEAAYRRGIKALHNGDMQRAATELQAAIDISPWFPRAQYSLGVAHAKQGRFGEAVEALSRAIRMDPADYQAYMALGLIYKKEFAGAEDAHAILNLVKALRLRPDLYRMHLLLGELYARTDRNKAREHYERFVRTADPADPDVERARRALEDLERAIRQDEPPDIAPPAEESLRFLPPELQRMINEAYLRGSDHQDFEGAEKILLEAKDRFRDEPAVYNELARVVYLRDRDDARRYWEQSLALKEDQVEVHERLGLLLRRGSPEAAVPHLRRAADLGSLTARFVLAQLLWEQTRPWQAAAELERYLAEAGDYDLHFERAQALSDEIQRRLWQAYFAGAILTLFALAVPTWRLYKRYRGKSLRQLLERDPKSFPEVARILSLIRHEILKHNTAFLADVGRALAADEPDSKTRAAVLADRLFGEAGPDTPGRKREPGREPGIYGRFLGYLHELEKVGRAHRVTLNLHRKDPIFGPMIRSFEALRRRRDVLGRVASLPPRRKQEVARILARAGEVLGRQAFDRLSGLIRELCVVRVDEAFVQAAFRQVAGEEQFAGAALLPLEVTGTGAPIRVFRTDLEDILVNLFRNSLRSSLAYASGPVGLGVDLAIEFDEITGLGTLAVRIKDRSPEQLSNEMLRGRYVERGMGITVDLLSRYDGSIAVEVEADPQWTKAVVLRFFVLEDDPVASAEVAA